MGLVIFVWKAEALKVNELNGQLVHLCEAILDKEDHLIYLPLSGKLMDVVKIFTQHNIEYLLRNEVFDGRL